MPCKSFSKTGIRVQIAFSIVCVACGTTTSTAMALMGEELHNAGASGGRRGRREIALVTHRPSRAAQRKDMRLLVIVPTALIVRRLTADGLAATHAFAIH